MVIPLKLSNGLVIAGIIFDSKMGLKPRVLYHQFLLAEANGNAI